MIWPSAKASSWLRRYADEVAGVAYTIEGDDTLYMCAGVAYYAVLHGVGYNTKKEFINLIKVHMGLDDDFLEIALSEIENNTFNTEKNK